MELSEYTVVAANGPLQSYQEEIQTDDAMTTLVGSLNEVAAVATLVDLSSKMDILVYTEMASGAR